MKKISQIRFFIAVIVFLSLNFNLQAKNTMLQSEAVFEDTCKIGTIVLAEPSVSFCYPQPVQVLKNADYTQVSAFRYEVKPQDTSWIPISDYIFGNPSDTVIPEDFFAWDTTYIRMVAKYEDSVGLSSDTSNILFVIVNRKPQIDTFDFYSVCGKNGSTPLAVQASGVPIERAVYISGRYFDTVTFFKNEINLLNNDSSVYHSDQLFSADGITEITRVSIYTRFENRENACWDSVSKEIVIYPNPVEPYLIQGDNRCIYEKREMINRRVYSGVTSYRWRLAKEKHPGVLIEKEGYGGANTTLLAALPGYVPEVPQGGYTHRVTNISGGNVPACWSESTIIPIFVDCPPIQQIEFEWDANQTKEIRIQAEAATKFIVNWGDGQQETVTGKGNETISLNHKYALDSAYRVQITGVNHECKLKALFLQNQNVKILNTHSALSLTYLDVSDNDLTDLDVSANSNLDTFIIANNRIPLINLHYIVQSLDSVSVKKLGMQFMDADTIALEQLVALDTLFYGQNTTITVNNTDTIAEAYIWDNGHIRFLEYGDYTVILTHSSWQTDSLYPGSIHWSFCVHEDADTSLGADVRLKALSISPGDLSPVFHPNTADYYIYFDNTTDSIWISALPNDDRATIEGDGLKVLDTGWNTFSIKVIAENKEDYKLYNLFVHKAKSTDAMLLSLAVEPGVLFPSFQPDVQDYVVFISEPTDSFTIQAEASHHAARVDGSGTFPVEAGVHVYTVSVKAEDPDYSLDYQLIVGYFPTTNLSKQESTVRIYPNPATDRLFIVSENETPHVKLFSQTGVLLIEKYAKEVDISMLTRGFYIVDVDGYKLKIVKK